MGAKVEIYKFKVTVFMAVIAAVGFMVVNSIEFLKLLNAYIYYVIIALLTFYGVIGFMKNMAKLSKLEKEIK